MLKMPECCVVALPMAIRRSDQIPLFSPLSPVHPFVCFACFCGIPGTISAPVLAPSWKTHVDYQAVNKKTAPCLSGPKTTNISKTLMKASRQPRCYPITLQRSARSALPRLHSVSPRLSIPFLGFPRLSALQKNVWRRTIASYPQFSGAFRSFRFSS